MQISTEPIIISMLAVAILYFVSLFVPSLLVYYCQSRKDVIERSICHRITQYSDDHPVRMIFLETIPALLTIAVVYSLYATNPTFVLLIQGLSLILIFNISRIIGSWRSGKYEY